MTLVERENELSGETREELLDMIAAAQGGARPRGDRAGSGGRRRLALHRDEGLGIPLGEQKRIFEKFIASIRHRHRDAGRARRAGRGRRDRDGRSPATAGEYSPSGHSARSEAARGGERVRAVRRSSRSRRGRRRRRPRRRSARRRDTSSAASRCRRDRVEGVVVGADEDEAVPDGGRGVDVASGPEAPEEGSGPGRERVDVTVERADVDVSGVDGGGRVEVSVPGAAPDHEPARARVEREKLAGVVADVDPSVGERGRRLDRRAGVEAPAQVSRARRRRRRRGRPGRRRRPCRRRRAATTRRGRSSRRQRTRPVAGEKATSSPPARFAHGTPDADEGGEEEIVRRAPATTSRSGASRSASAPGRSPDRASRAARRRPPRTRCRSRRPAGTRAGAGRGTSRDAGTAAAPPARRPRAAGRCRRRTSATVARHFARRPARGVVAGTGGGGIVVGWAAAGRPRTRRERRPRRPAPTAARPLGIARPLPLRWLQRLEKKRDSAGQWALASKLMAPASNTVERPVGVDRHLGRLAGPSSLGISASTCVCGGEAEFGSSTSIP